MTASEAEQAYADGSYKTLSDDELKAAADACMNVGGVNEINVGRVRQVGTLLREEYERRKQRAIEQYSLGNIPNESSVADLDTKAEPWTEERLLSLIANKIEENLQLEYKSAASLKREDRQRLEITKDVSAFANSAGGTLIYGISEGREKAVQHLPEKLDPIKRSDISREWLEHVISSIRPRIPHVRVVPVPLGDSADSVAYIVEVPHGATAHQATDCRYYRRYNFESVMMLDHEVRDVMNRKNQPELKISAELVFFQNFRQDGLSGNLIFHIQNDSDVFARYIALIIDTPLHFQGKSVAFEEGLLLNDRESGWQLRYSNHARAPLFPRVKLSPHFYFRFGRLTFNNERQPELTKIRFTAYADSMPPLHGEIDPASLAKTQ